LMVFFSSFIPFGFNFDLCMVLLFNSMLMEIILCKVYPYTLYSPGDKWRHQLEISRRWWVGVPLHGMRNGYRTGNWST
jgi:hypothetical protein